MLVIQATLSGRGICLGWRGLIDKALNEGQLVPAFDRTVASGRAYHIERSEAGTKELALKMFENIQQAARQVRCAATDLEGRDPISEVNVDIAALD